MLIETSLMDACQPNRSMACCRSSRMYGFISGYRRLMTLPDAVQLLANW